MTTVLTAPETLAAPVNQRPIASAATPVLLEDCVKSFGDLRVLDGLSLAVPAGCITGLIGPSGCGKTTTIRLILGVLAPDGGRVLVLGGDPTWAGPAERARIGYTPQQFVLYPTMTVQENASFVGALYGLGWRRRRRRVRQVLELLELWSARRRLSRDISGGMQRRLALGCALLHEPQLLIVDEPTAGLDPLLRARVWAHLRALACQGVTVLVTTQHIEEATYCDSVAILNDGRVAAAGPPDTLRRQALGGEALHIEADGLTREALAALWALAEVRALDQHGPAALRLTVDTAASAIPAVTRALASAGVAPRSIHPVTASFDEVFMKIVGQR